MKKIKFILAAFALSLTIISCERDNTTVPLELDTAGVYVLNSGKFNSNNTSLTLFNADKQVYQDVFLDKNGIKLGDTGQDIIAYGNKIYISIYNSGVIFVTDLKAKKIGEIKLSDYKAPRYLTSYKGKVYASYYDGAVAQIDTTTFEAKTLKVGANPEQLKVANGKLYVANSGGMSYPDYGNTVSVIDLNTFTVSKDITVGLNPCNIQVDNDQNVYLISMGNYETGKPNFVAPSFQVIDSKTDVVEVIDLKFEGKDISPANMVFGTDKLYLMELGYDENWNAEGYFYVFNTKNKTIEKSFFTDGTLSIPNCYSISFSSNSLFIGSSDYINSGDMYVYSKEGTFVTKFTTGLNPIAVTPFVIVWK